MLERPLSQLTAPEFHEFGRGWSSQGRGQPFNEHESELWKRGWRDRNAQKQERAKKWN